MASLVDWKNLGGEEKEKSGGNRNGKAKFLKFESGKDYTIRLIGRAFEFYKFFIKQTNRSVVVDIEDVDAAAAMLLEEFGQEIKPQRRFAINVIDRSDKGIKIMECGHTVFRQFALWAKGNDTQPGGLGGGDWMIDVTGDGLNRKYNAQCIRPAPLTEEEIKRVRKDGGEVHDLESFYKGTPLSQVVTKAKGIPEADSNDIPKAQNTAAPAAQAAAATKISDNDLW